MSSIMRARSGLMGVSLIGVLLVLRLGFGHPHPQARALQIPLPLALPGLNAASARVIAAGYRVSGFVVCPACSIAGECESPIQPDGGEGLAKHKGQSCRSGRDAVKAIELTWGDLRHC